MIPIRIYRIPILVKIQEILAKAIEVLKAFFTSQPAADQAIVSQEAKTGLLKNPVLWLTGFSKSYSSKKFSASSSSSLASSSSISLSRRKCQKKTPSANFKLSQEETSTLESHPTGSSNSFSRSLNESSSQRSSSGGLSQEGTSIKSFSEVSTSSLESPRLGSSNSSAGSLTMSSTNLSRRKVVAASPSSREKSQDESFSTLSFTVSAEGNLYNDSSGHLSEGSNGKAPSKLSHLESPPSGFSTLSSIKSLSMQERRTQGESPSKEASLEKAASVHTTQRSITKSPIDSLSTTKDYTDTSNLAVGYKRLFKDTPVLTTGSSGTPIPTAGCREPSKNTSNITKSTASSTRDSSPTAAISTKVEGDSLTVPSMLESTLTVPKLLEETSLAVPESLEGTSLTAGLPKQLEGSLITGISTQLEGRLLAPPKLSEGNSFVYPSS